MKLTQLPEVHPLGSHCHPPPSPQQLHTGQRKYPDILRPVLCRTVHPFPALSEDQEKLSAVHHIIRQLPVSLPRSLLHRSAPHIPVPYSAPFPPEPAVLPDGSAPDTEGNSVQIRLPRSSVFPQPYPFLPGVFHHRCKYLHLRSHHRLLPAVRPLHKPADTIPHSPGQKRKLLQSS